MIEKPLCVKGKKGFQKGHKGGGFRGKKHSDEFKEMQSELKKTDNPLFKLEARKKLSEQRKGENNPNWKGGISYPDNDPRYTFEYKEWRRQVFIRDNFTCQECESKSSKGKYTYLTAHHIKSFSQYPELRHSVDNGLTLCIQCHAKETGHEMLKNNNGYRCND